MKCKHLEDVGETYFQHFKAATSIGFMLLVYAIICFIHAIFPWLFSAYVSTKICILAEKMKCRIGKANKYKDNE